jgi:hypothetical protein
VDGYKDVIACLTADERTSLLTAVQSSEHIAAYPGAQINTDPTTWQQEVTVGNSTYFLIDAHEQSYHPVFGVQ